MGKLEETRRKAVADKLKAEADAEARNIKAQDALQQAKDAVAKALQDRKAAEEKAAQAAREEARKGIQASMDAAQKRVAQIDAENARLDKEARAERTQRGMAADARHHNGLFGAYQYDTDKDGNIRRLRDYQRAQRYAERDMRENASAENERAKAEKRLERLEGMRHKSARTQKEIDQIKGFLGQGAKSPEEQIQENTKEAAKLLKEIKES